MSNLTNEFLYVNKNNNAIFSMILLNERIYS